MITAAYNAGQGDAMDAAYDEVLRLQREIAELRGKELLPCTWTEDEDTMSYDTACGNKHLFIEGTPRENNYRFCPYCGGALVDGATMKEENHD